MSEASAASPGRGSLHLLARLAAAASAALFFSTSATPSLERALTGRAFDLPVLLVPLGLVLVYTLIALAPWPRGGWSGALLIAVAYLGPVVALMSTVPVETRPRLLPMLLFGMPCQAVLIRAGIAWRRRHRDAGRAYARSPLFWALVWTAANPAALLLGGLPLVPHHPRNNEARTIDDLRSFVLAQALYQSAASGAFGPPRCLVEPHRCIPGYPVEAPVMASPDTVEGVRAGYLRTFHAVPASGDDAPAVAGPIRGYALLAVPVEPGVSGRRSFCADAAGRVCAWGDGGVPPLEAGGCPQECDPAY